MINRHKGIRTTRLYGIWRTIRTRCNTPTNKDYKRYGARGIKVCDEWNDFETFYKWAMNNGYKDDLTIDRIDVNGNYESNNCRWVTSKSQARNRRNNTVITYKNESHCITEWAEITGIHKDTISYRLKHGYTPDEIFEKPVHHEYRRRCK